MGLLITPRVREREILGEASRRKEQIKMEKNIMKQKEEKEKVRK
jgi:hypothetical protein